MVSVQEFLQASGVGGALSSLLLHVLDHSPRDPVLHFEQLLASAAEERQLLDVVADEKLKAACVTVLSQFKRKVEAAEGEEPPADEEDPDAPKKPPPPPDLIPTLEEGENDGKVDDVVGDLAMLENAGVGFGPTQTFKLYVSLKRLAKKLPAESVRFFGVIKGVTSDYWVAEVVFKEGERGAGPGDEKPEGEGEGEEEAAKPIEPDNPPREDPAEGEAEWLSNVNQYCYFVASSPEGAWVRLPDILPKHVVLSRRVRKFFSGNLSTPVHGLAPPFPGTEAHLLRCAIARIKHGTFIGPKGLLVDNTEEDAEEPSVAKAEEFAGHPSAEMTAQHLGNWVHLAREILPQGRCAFMRWPPPPEEEEAEEEEGKEKPKPYVEVNAKPLRSIHLDKPLPGTTSAWTTATVSDVIPDYAVAVAKSNRWPGATAVAFGNRVVNVYVGWGLKTGIASGVTGVAPAVFADEADPAEDDDLKLPPKPPAAEPEPEEE